MPLLVCPAPTRLAGVGLGVMSWRVFGLMVLKGLADNVLSDYLWARAILLVGERQGRGAPGRGAAEPACVHHHCAC